MKKLISESINPVEGSFDSNHGVVGEPAVPMKFEWGGKEHEIDEILKKWKDAGDCKSGGGERYVRKHCFKVRTKDGAVMNIYFDRQARSAAQRKKRWWLNSIEEE